MDKALLDTDIVSEIFRGINQRVITKATAYRAVFGCYTISAIKAAKTALIGLYPTQQKLADALEVTRQPISKFFNGKPVARDLFVRICEKLKLDWQAIAQKDDELEVDQNRNEGSDIDALVQEIREKIKPNIRERCGKMRVLDMNQPIELTGERGIYTNVNILEKITGRRRLDIPELLQNCEADDFERFGLNKVTEKRVPGLQAVERYSKLMVLGKPGAGKTTFLKYLAMQCIEGQFQANRVPLFITLKDFAEAPKQPDLLECSELYKEGLDVLLKKWDAKRNIERDQVYKNLSVQRKEDLLSQIALSTFEQKDYFFKQKTVEAYIADFIRNLYNEDPDPTVLRLDSEAVLKSIEAQHGLLAERAKGIYSFSHLTFQEYFAAREINANAAYASLVDHITEKRWREVFLLTAGMIRNANDLMRLMKQKIDGLCAQDEKLQRFLIWVSEKSLSVKVPYKAASIRAFYVDLDRNLDLELALEPEFDLALALDVDLNRHTEPSSLHVDIEIDRDLNLVLNLALDNGAAYVRDLYCVFDDALDHACKPELRRALQKLNAQLPSPDCAEWEFMQWWKANGKDWTKRLETVMNKYRNIGHDWQFSEEQKELLGEYYDANKLLVDCLNSDSYVSREVRQQIEDTLLLPMAEIKKRQQGRTG